MDEFGDNARAGSIAIPCVAEQAGSDDLLSFQMIAVLDKKHTLLDRVGSY